MEKDWKMMRKRILIVDDDPCVGDLLEELLTGEGYGALRAYSGTEALLLLEKEQPDLVLLDRMLPGCRATRCCGISRTSL